MWIESLLLYMFNLAVASLLCTTISLIAASLFRSLPKRHASLVIGLSICLVAPVLVGLSGLFSLGVLPTLSIDDASSAEDTAALPVAQPLAIGSRENSPVLPVSVPSSTSTIRELSYTTTTSVDARQDEDSKESSKDSTVMRSEAALPNKGQSTKAWVGGISLLGWIAGILTMIVQVFATTCYWWNPFVWIVSRKIALLRELICDDIVLRNEPTARAYPESIITLAEQSSQLAPWGMSFSSVSELEQRIRRIVSHRVPGLETRLGHSAMIGVLLFALVLTTGIIVAQVPFVPAQQGSISVAANQASNSPVNKPAEFGKGEFPANLVSGTVFLASGKPAANAKLRIVGHRQSNIDARLTTDSMGQFEFVVRFKTEALGQLRFAAEAADGSELAFHRFGWKPEELVTEGISIMLQPTRIAEVEVVDGKDQPIVGARVAVQLTYPNILHGSETDASGKASVILPVTERIETVMAWKDHAGLDYRVYQLSRSEQADTKALPPEFPPDRPERLVLDGVQPVTVTVVDGTDRAPIEGAEVFPWVLSKDQASEGLNFSFFTQLIAQRTSEAGVTTFAWMPAWQRNPFSFWASVEGYQGPHGRYDPATNEGKLRLALHRLVSIQGKVVDSNGQPVEGAELSAHGKGRSMSEFRSLTRTDLDGKYELEVAPNHNYLLTAKDESRVSAPHTGLVVYPHTPLENRDFKLRAPTRVHGRLINERTQEPIPNTRVIVYHYGTELMDIPDANIPNPENERWSVRPIIQHYATTEGDGKFEFMLGDGSFDLRPPQQEKTEKFEIRGQSELEFTVTTQVHSEVELVGLVVSKSDGLPIKAARVEGVPRNFGSMYWTATADDEGKFRVLRRQEPTYVLAKNEDKTLASIVEVGDLNRTFIIQLESVGNASGRLVNNDGQPIVGQRINFSVDVPDVDNDTFSPRFGGHVVTEDNGEFRLESLVANWEYKITFTSTPEGTIPRLTTVTVKPGESVELGNLTEPAPYKSYVPPTLDEQIKSAFEVEGTPLERHQRALQKVQLVNQHLLIVFGQPNDPRIHRLMEIRYNDDDFRSLSDEYRFMAIPTDIERLPSAQALARVLGQVLNEASQTFYLVLLDAEGRAVAAAGDAELCVSSELSKDLLFEFLQRHQTQPLDGRQLLDDALLRATQENKRVLVQETATWCGPCHLLSEFLDENRSWEKDYIWIKMDHRWKGAQEIMAEFRDGAEGGIPWFVILDAQGKKLTTSNDSLTGKNIGFPSEPSSRKHFANMLHTTRQRMTEADVQALVDAIDSQK